MASYRAGYLGVASEACVEGCHGLSFSQGGSGASSSNGKGGAGGKGGHDANGKNGGTFSGTGQKKKKTGRKAGKGAGKSTK